LVNNHKKCNLDWKSSGWSRIDEIYDNTTFLTKFDQSELFDHIDCGGVLPNLAVVLSAFCDYPKRIKRLFLSDEYNPEGAYLGRVFHKGWWKPVLVDNYVPHDDDKRPIALPPAKERETTDAFGLSIVAKSITKEINYNVGNHDNKNIEIWPSVVAKILAKHYINYERLAKQEVAEFMKDLTGMPTNTYKVRKVDQTHMRKYWKNQFVVIAKPTKEFIKTYVA